MIIRRLMVALFLVLAASFSSVSPAGATDATYPPGGDSITVPDTEVTAGGPVTVRASGFRPGSSVTFVLNIISGGERAAGTTSLTETVTADGDGVATATFQLPDGVSGTLPVTATGVAPDGSTRTVAGTVAVSSGVGGGTGENLPKTGGNLTPFYIGGALLIIGAVLIAVFYARRSNRAGGSA